MCNNVKREVAMGFILTKIYDETGKHTPAPVGPISALPLPLANILLLARSKCGWNEDPRKSLWPSL